MNLGATSMRHHLSFSCAIHSNQRSPTQITPHMPPLAPVPMRTKITKAIMAVPVGDTTSASGERSLMHPGGSVSPPESPVVTPLRFRFKKESRNDEVNAVSDMDGDNVTSSGSSAFISTPPMITTFLQDDKHDTAVPAIAHTVTGAETSFFYRSPNHAVRQRTPQACEKCRERKTKCTGTRPICKRCSDRGLNCFYAPDVRGRAHRYKKTADLHIDTFHNLDVQRKIAISDASPARDRKKIGSTGIANSESSGASTPVHESLTRAPKNEIVYMSVSPPSIMVPGSSGSHGDYIATSQWPAHSSIDSGLHFSGTTGYMRPFPHSLEYDSRINTPPSATSTHFSMPSDLQLADSSVLPTTVSAFGVHSAGDYTAPSGFMSEEELGKLNDFLSDAGPPPIHYKNLYSRSELSSAFEEDIVAQYVNSEFAYGLQDYSTN